MREAARVRLRALVAAAALGGAAVVVVQFWTAHARQPRLAAGFGDSVALPDGRVVSARPLPGPGARMALFVAHADGRDARRITFGDAQDRAPALLPDGRILFRRADRRFVINPDGTGLQLFTDPAGGAASAGGPWLRPPLGLTSVVDARKSTGTLLCLDVRTSRVPAVSGATPGAIRVVRLLAADGQVLGEAPVEADGSFFIEVPADQPLHLELHRADGAVAADHSGFWVRPNENRGCIGCHEDPELAPDNRVVLALARGATRVGTTALVMESHAP